MLFMLKDTATTEIYTKHIKTQRGQNVEYLSGKYDGTNSDQCAVHIVTTGP
jgi:hypothetical protein